jgi:hypothetical protein
MPDFIFVPFAKKLGRIDRILQGYDFFGIVFFSFPNGFVHPLTIYAILFGESTAIFNTDLLVFMKALVGYLRGIYKVEGHQLPFHAKAPVIWLQTNDIIQLVFVEFIPLYGNDVFFEKIPTFRDVFRLLATKKDTCQN